MIMNEFMTGRYDVGGDGYLDLQELKITMERLRAPQTHLGLKAMIIEVDEDRDGKLSFREVGPTPSTASIVNYTITVFFFITSLAQWSAPLPVTKVARVQIPLPPIILLFRFLILSLLSLTLFFLLTMQSVAL